MKYFIKMIYHGVVANVVISIVSLASYGAENVILMISDGLGFNGWQAARYYEGGLPYDNTGFNFYGCTNYQHGGSYDPTAMWSNFNYQKSGATDSAAAATALYTGEKTYGGAISVDVNQNPLTTIAENAAALGKATGAVTSVQYNHATPAAVDAHNTSRNNYGSIASEMITSDLDVIMGGDSKSPGSQVYADAANNGFAIVRDTNLNDWDTLADGTYNGGNLPDKVFGGFGGDTLNGRAKPTLDLMTQGALNVLSQDADGFFLMVEGGAVDWNNHGNNMRNMLREQVDFDNAVASVITWIEANGGWDDNLLIITADHETGSIWGPNVGTFDHIMDNGVGVIPGHSYNSDSHTNQLVPLWAKGAGADGFNALVDGVDTSADAFWSEAQGWDWDGGYVDNSDVFEVMNTQIPEPTTMILIGLGSLGMFRRRGRARLRGNH